MPNIKLAKNPGCYAILPKLSKDALEKFVQDTPCIGLSGQFRWDDIQPKFKDFNSNLITDFLLLCDKFNKSSYLRIIGGKCSPNWVKEKNDNKMPILWTCGYLDYWCDFIGEIGGKLEEYPVSCIAITGVGDKDGMELNTKGFNLRKKRKYSPSALTTAWIRCIDTFRWAFQSSDKFIALDRPLNNGFGIDIINSIVSDCESINIGIGANWLTAKKGKFLDIYNIITQSSELIPTYFRELCSSRSSRFSGTFDSGVNIAVSCGASVLEVHKPDSHNLNSIERANNLLGNSQR